MKSFFSLVNSVVGGEQKPPEKKVSLPWEDYKEQARLLNIKGSLTDILRDKMNEIYLDEKFLFNQTDSLEDFILDEHTDVILKLLDIDLNLRELYRKNVPNRVTEDYFWKNYFSRVEAIKNETLAKFSNKTPSETYHNNLLDELDKELEAEDLEVYRPKVISKLKNQKEKADQIEEKKIEDEVSALKRTLEAALKKIEALENRVLILEAHQSPPSEY